MLSAFIWRARNGHELRVGGCTKDDTPAMILRQLRVNHPEISERDFTKEDLIIIDGVLPSDVAQALWDFATSMEGRRRMK